MQQVTPAVVGFGNVHAVLYARGECCRCEKSFAMKNLLVPLLLLSVPAICANAQSFTSRQGYTFPDNEISVSYGVGSYPELVVSLAGALGTAFSLGMAQVSDLYIIGSFAAEYQHYVHRSIAVGGVVSYEYCGLSFSGAEEGAETRSAGGDPDGGMSFIALMPSVKFKWFSLPHFSMYSKVAAGLMLAMSGGSITPQFAFQLSAAGVDFGGEKLRGFVEAGSGCQGMLSCGVRVCF